MQTEYTLKDIERFWNKVYKASGTDACWIWSGYCTPAGYGQISIHNRLHYTHRVAFELANGISPDGLLVCHSCDNPPCCNPSHLFLGTNKENAEDRERKNRGNQVRGDNHPRHKLSEIQVAEIRNLYAEKKASASKIAKDFRISPTHVYCLVNNKRRA